MLINRYFDNCLMAACAPQLHRIALMVLAGLAICLASYTQGKRNLPSDSLLQANAARMAKTMSDSLKLTNVQKNRLEAANLQIAMAKRQARADTLLSPDKMAGRLQRAENMRDSLYRRILPAEKFDEYTRRRATLLTTW